MRRTPNPADTHLWNDETEEYDIPLPTVRVVCPQCHGQGVHDAWEGGMTQSEMDEQGPEFFEDYMAGHYSVPCTYCLGRNVVDEVDEARLTPEQRTAWHQQQQDRWESEAADRSERLAFGY